MTDMEMQKSDKCGQAKRNEVSVQKDGNPGQVGA